MSEDYNIKQNLEVDANQAKAALDDVARREQALAKEIQAQAQAAEQASAADRKRSAQLARMQKQLDEQSREEVRYQMTVSRGATINEEDARHAQRRAARIERLGKVLGFEQRANDLASASIRKHARATQEATQKQSAFNQVVGAAGSGISGLATSLVGAGGLAAGFRMVTEWADAATRAIERNAKVASEQTQQRLELSALQGIESGETRDFIDRAAVFAGRSPGEVALAYQQTKSYFPRESEEYIQNIIAETAVLAQSSTAPMGDIAVGMRLLTKDLGDAKKASNVLQKAIDEAGEGQSKNLVPLIGKLLGVGQSIGGLNASESAGFVAALTSLGLPNEEAVTGGKNVMFALKGKGTPEGRGVLEREGITDGQLVDQLRQLAQAYSTGKITPAELESIGGREAAPVFTQLSDPAKLEQFLQTMAIVDQASNQDERIAETKIKGVVGSSKAQELLLRSKQAAAKTEVTRGHDTRAQEIKTVREQLEAALAIREQQGAIAIQRSEEILNAYDMLTSAMVSPATAVRLSQPLAKPMAGWTGLLRSLAGTPEGYDLLLEKYTLDPSKAGAQTDVEDAFKDLYTNPSLAPTGTYNESSTPMQPAGTSGGGASGGGGVTHIDQSTHVHVNQQHNYATNPLTDIRNPLEAEDR